MQTSENNRMTKVNHRKVQSSTTLSRKYTKRPARSADVMVQVKKSPQIRRFQDPVATNMKRTVKEADPIMAAEPHPVQNIANARMKARAAATQAMQSPSRTPRVTAKELKDQAIKKALASAAKTEEKEMMTTNKSKEKIKSGKPGEKVYFGMGRILLALSCAAAAVFAIVYFVNLNMPDISLRVAAMQTGIDPTYPNYVPRGYSVSGITSEENKISLEFKNASEGTAFTLTEEKSSWDSNALASNYVKDTYGENYSIVREQGITIYINDSNAAWVNGGTVYKIIADSGTLSNKQIRSIAVSL